MVTHQFQYKERQKPETILVMPASEQHLDELQALAGEAYNIPQVDIESWFSTDQYRSRIEKFPEGQWIAQDKASGRVVGFTSGMRFDFNPHIPLLDSWENTTGYG